jgi:hypothetical protein
MKKVHVSKKAIAMACMFALALVVAAISGVPARTQDNSGKTPAGVLSPGQGTSREEPLVLAKHVLNATYYDASSSLVTAVCQFAGCQAPPVFVFNESIACPGPAGTKCTYEVQISGQTSVAGPGNEGLLQFLIDGATPTGGGTDPNGFYFFESQGAGGIYTSAYSVTSQVKNTSANQAHSIGVLVSCQDTQSLGGCGASTGQASLTVRVMKP